MMVGEAKGITIENNEVEMGKINFEPYSTRRCVYAQSFHRMIIKGRSAYCYAMARIAT